MKKASTLTGFSALVLASVFVSTVTAAPKDSPPDEWDILVNDVGVLVEKTTGIESDISDVQAGVDGVQGSVENLTATISTISEVGINGIQGSVDGVQSSVDGLIIDVANVQSSVNGVGDKVDGVQSSVSVVGGQVDGVESKVDGVQGSVDDLANSLSALETVIADLVGGGVFTEHPNGDELVQGVTDSNVFDRWTYGDYANPRHVSLTLQARGMDTTDFVSVWVRTHTSESTDSDKNIRYVYELDDFNGPSWVQQIEFDAIEWGLNVNKNDSYSGASHTTEIHLTWAATVSAPDYQNGAQSVFSDESNTFYRSVNGDYADPRHVSLTLQARGMDTTDFVSVWVRTHTSDSTDSDKNIRYVYELDDFNGPSWVQQIEFDAIEWGLNVHKNDSYSGASHTDVINLTWAATID